MREPPDFADAAHLTRTFYQMVGMAPSALMRGDFVEIASPFTELPPKTQGLRQGRCGPLLFIGRQTPKNVLVKPNEADLQLTAPAAEIRDYVAARG